MLAVLFFSPADPAAAGSAVIMARPQVSIRADATVQSERIAVLEQGQEVERLGRKDEWLRIRLTDGRSGWVHSELVRPVSATPADADTPSAAERPVVRPFVRGLQYELEGEHGKAVEQFLLVPTADSRYQKAQIHAATAYRRLGQFDESRRMLERVLAQGGETRRVYADLAELYKASGRADSARKYATLAQGIDWQPPAPVESDAPGDERYWVMSQLLGCAAAVLGTAVLLSVALLALRRTRRNGRQQGSFARALQECEQPMSPDSQEDDQDLDKRIAQLRQQLRDTASPLRDGGNGVACDDTGEAAELERVAAHLDVLRQAMDMQEKRARIYADLVQLQTMRIRALEEEVALRRRSQTRA